MKRYVAGALMYAIEVIEFVCLLAASTIKIGRTHRGRSIVRFIFASALAITGYVLMTSDSARTDQMYPGPVGFLLTGVLGLVLTFGGIVVFARMVQQYWQDLVCEIDELDAPNEVGLSTS